MNANNIKLIFCSFVPVGLEDYVNYMKNKFSDFVYFRWKFHFIGSKKIYSAVQTFKNGKMICEKRICPVPKVDKKIMYFFTLPIIYLVYLFQAVNNLAYVKRDGKTVVFMGINYFCTLCGVVLKKMGRVDHVIYRVMDFFPLPEKGAYRIFNRFFYVLDKICLKNSDAIWFTTSGHIEGREKYGYFDRKNYFYEIIPLGVRVDNLLSVPAESIKNHSIIYSGVLSRYHMLNILFDAIKKLKERYPDIVLNIIGSGPDENYFKELAVKMGLKANIVFHGFVKDEVVFSKIISENSLGIALYRDEENFMKYTEPAKVKTYLSCGVPVIVSDVPKIAEEVAKNRVGFSMKNDVNLLCEKIEEFLNDEKLQKEFKDNVSRYIRNFDIDRLLDEKFNHTFKEIGINNG